MNMGSVSTGMNGDSGGSSKGSSGSITSGATGDHAGSKSGRMIGNEGVRDGSSPGPGGAGYINGSGDAGITTGSRIAGLIGRTGISGMKIDGVKGIGDIGINGDSGMIAMETGGEIIGAIRLYTGGDSGGGGVIGSG